MAVFRVLMFVGGWVLVVGVVLALLYFFMLRPYLRYRREQDEKDREFRREEMEWMERNK